MTRLRPPAGPLPALLLALALLVPLAGCGGGDEEQAASTMSRAERDSALAESALPGAAAVGGALDAADSASARARRLDEASGGDRP